MSFRHTPIHTRFAFYSAWASILAWAPISSRAAAELLPPGHRPQAHHAHALVHAKVVTEPGQTLTNATVIIRNGLIEKVGNQVDIPADARVWNLEGSTIYAGFIDLYWTQNSSGNAVNNNSYDPFRRTRHAGVEGTLDNSLTGGAINTGFFGVVAEEKDPGNPGPGYELSSITPERRVAESFKPDSKAVEEMRNLGFTAACAAPDRGLIRGQSALVHLAEGNPNDLLLKPDLFQHIAFDTDSGRDGAFPKSLMGVIAAWRQTVFDAEWYEAAQNAYKAAPLTVARPGQNPSLSSLQPVLKRTQKWVVEPGSVLMMDRAHRLTREFRQDALLVATGEEWRRPEFMGQWTNTTLIVPLPQSAPPKMPTQDDWMQVTLEDLRSWDWAPENPALLAQNRARFALTTHGLGDRKDFTSNLRRSIRRGLSPDVALAALTTIPAQECGMADRLGKIAPGYIADLTVFDGSDFTQKEAQVREVWIDGHRFTTSSEPHAKKEKGGEKEKEKDKEKPVIAKPDKAEEKEALESKRVAAPADQYRGILAQPAGVLVRNATIWTSGPQGILTNATLWVQKGKIVAVGNDVPAPGPEAGEIQIIDGTGMHVTPGLVDAHNHSMILGAVNEATLPSTAMVRISDVINSEAPTIYQQLAGGLTVANELHGSANPIGGQNCVIKLRHGAAPEDLKFEDAPAGIKFALGENVKQSNWGDKNVSRFPQTRMGVRTFFANRFTAAREYLKMNKTWKDAGATGVPPRRNLELEALGEILEGKRWIHCHSYRQDEILAFLRVMEDFQVQVGTLQHVLEGYKIADEIAKHGAGASCFSDWWAYKFEVYDAIPHAGSLMHARGALVSFNSDSSDLARRMNLEAAKAVRYGETPEVEALKFVTLNPAKQLRIDHRVGSLEVGKDGDFVIWSGSPLDATKSCLQTWIEGRKYFDRVADAIRAQAMSSERVRLIEKAKKLTDSADDKPASEAARSAFFRRLWETARHTDVMNCQDCVRRQD